MTKNPLIPNGNSGEAVKPSVQKEDLKYIIDVTYTGQVSFRRAEDED